MNTQQDQRYYQLRKWVGNIKILSVRDLTPLAGDASFRRYFRVHLTNNSTLVAMDAPPDKENSAPFIAVAEVFRNQNLHVPEILKADLDQGFLLLTDFGDDLYFRLLNTENADQLYKNAMQSLLIIQSCTRNNGWHFPAFDYEALM